MARIRKIEVTESTAGLGDVELVLLASGGRRDDRLIEPPSAMKPVTRHRAAANLRKRGLAIERPARLDEPVWGERNGERLTLQVTPTGLTLIGLGDEGHAEPADAAPAGGTDPTRPKDGTRGALLVSMLSRPEGVSVDDLIAATGWLPHTTRAALSGLRKQGFAIERESGEAGSRYRIPAPEPKPEPAPARRRVRRAKEVAATATA